MIDLSAIPLTSAEPEVQDFGGVLTPPLGGPVQRIDRVGTRWTIAFQTPNLEAEPSLRIWSTRLACAQREGALVWIPEPDLVARPYGVPMVAQAIAGGMLVSVAGLTPGVAIVEGKWLSIVHDGRRYLHRSTSGTMASPDGSAVLALYPPLRISLAPGDAVELAFPRIQGSLVGRIGWPIDVARFGALSFTVAEDE